MPELFETNKVMICSCCNTSFNPKEGKHLIKDNQIICSLCIENYENDEEAGTLLLG